MKKVLVLVCLICFIHTAQSEEINVPGDFSKISTAIAKSHDYDTIIVWPGVYKERIDFFGKTIHVKSKAGPEQTVIDGNASGSVVIFKTQEGPMSVIEGFTITNGLASSLTGTMLPLGGGIYCKNSSPTIKNNIITDNTANSSGAKGGGIYCDEFSSPVIMNNRILKNHSKGSKEGPGYGGGVACGSNASPVLINNIISTNYADERGGGISCEDDAHVKMFSCMITDNELAPLEMDVDGLGGGVYMSCKIVEIINCTIAKNTCNSGAGKEGLGGGFCNNGGSGEMVNTIVWHNKAEDGAKSGMVKNVLNSKMEISYSNIEGGAEEVVVEVGGNLVWGSTVIFSNPEFVSFEKNDYHILHNSPCRKLGLEHYAGIPETDFEGDKRDLAFYVDMGADEFHDHLYCAGEFSPGGLTSIKMIGMPGTGPVGLFFSGDSLETPLASDWGDWYLSFPTLGPLVFPSLPASGLLEINGTIPGSPAEYSVSMQAIMGAKLTNLFVLYVK